MTGVDSCRGDRQVRRQLASAAKVDQRDAAGATTRLKATANHSVESVATTAAHADDLDASVAAKRRVSV